MAHPDTDDGYLKVANELAEAFCQLSLPGYDWRVLWVILRQTYGWNRKADRITGAFISNKTGIKRVHVYRSLANLERIGIIKRAGKQIGIQKDYSLWKIENSEPIETKTGKAKDTKAGIENIPDLVQNGSANIPDLVHDDTKFGIKMIPDLVHYNRQERHSSKDIDMQRQLAQQFFATLAEVCKFDLQTLTEKQRGMLNQTVVKLYQASASPEDVHQFGDYWQAVDWRGKKGQAPTPAQVREEWGRFRAWQQKQAGEGGGIRWVSNSPSS